MMARFGLSDPQVEAILNMRLRALRRLEEIQIKGEHDKLTAERASLVQLLGGEALRWAAIGREIAEMKKKFGGDTKLGKRRSAIEAAPVVTELSRAAAIEREPVTVLVSEKGWARAVGGHDVDLAAVKYKEGDRGRFVIKADTTDLVVVFATDGKAFTLEADKLPRGRGFGEPLRLMVDMGNDAVDRVPPSARRQAAGRRRRLARLRGDRGRDHRPHPLRQAGVESAGLGRGAGLRSG
jgi:topoisomerase-4 subunit A